jgi:hypothetical protein
MAIYRGLDNKERVIPNGRDHGFYRSNKIALNVSSKGNIQAAEGEESWRGSILPSAIIDQPRNTPSSVHQVTIISKLKSPQIAAFPPVTQHLYAATIS